jgi:septal ring factor EnvC (AmiA/AmiB activator)
VCPRCHPGEQRRADYAVEFKDFSACVDFLSLMLQNRAALHVNRTDFDSIVVSGAGEREYFTVLLRGVAEDKLELLRGLARAPGVPTDVQNDLRGELHTINEFLQRIRLVPHMESPGGNGIAVALFGAQDRQYRDWHTQLLDMGCGGIRAGFVEDTPANDYLSHILLVDRVPASFDPPRDWVQGQGREGTRALTFYRLRNQRDCPFYVEWDYDCPLGDVDGLYDLTEAQCHTMLICADSPQRERGGRNGPPPERMEPHWLCLGEHEVKHIFQFPETPLCLPQGEAARRVDLEARSPSGDAVLDLRVKRDSRSVGATPGSIENDIAWHQRAIEELMRDHRTAHTIRQESLYLAFLFRQILPADAQGADGIPPLNPNFRRLLEQPYTYLRHMKYGFYEDPASTETEPYGLHVVIDDHPGTYGQLLTQLADEVFIQRSEWHEWGLPLFVRHGDEVRPRLEHESLKDPIRELLWKDHADNDVPVLLRTLPHRDGSDERQSWEIVYVRDTKLLTSHECFQFLNDRFSAHLLAFRRDIPGDLQEELKQNKVQVTQQTKELEQAVCDAADKGIKDAEEHWETVEKEIDEVEKDSKRLAAVVAEMERTIAAAPGDWSKFFLDILKSNETLMRAGVEAFQAYREAHGEALKKIDDYERGLQEVNATLVADNQKLDARSTELTALDAQCRDAEAKLKELLKVVAVQLHHVQRKITKTNEDIGAEVGRVATKIRQLSEQVKAVEEKIAVAKAAQKRLLAVQKELSDRETELKALDDENKRLHDDNEATKKRLAAMAAEILATRAALLKEEKELAAKVEEYQRLLDGIRRRRAEVAEQKRKLDTDIPEHQEEWKTLTKQYEQLKATQQMLESQEKSLTKIWTLAEKLCKQNGESKEQLLAQIDKLIQRTGEIRKTIKRLRLPPGPTPLRPRSSGQAPSRPKPSGQVPSRPKPPEQEPPGPWWLTFWKFWKR